MSVEPLTGVAYREAVADGGGGRLDVSRASTPRRDHGVPTVRTLLSSPRGDICASRAVDAAAGSVPTHRRPRSRRGVGRAGGTRPLRRRLRRPRAVATARPTTTSPLAQFATPVRGTDPYQLAVGPIHAGVIESGHFRFHVVGDLILHVDARLFYKHRGLERAAEGLALADGASGRRPSLRRLLGDERRRLRAGLRGGARPRCRRPSSPGCGRSCSSSSASGTRSTTSAPSAPGSGSLRERAGLQPSWTTRGRLNARLTGHRFLFGSVASAAARSISTSAAVADARETLARIRLESSRAWHELLFNGSFMDRMPDIGIVDASAVRSLGVVGLAARAAGVAEDVRTTQPRLAYEGFARGGAPASTPVTCRPGSSSGRSSCCRASTSSTGC